MTITAEQADAISQWLIAAWLTYLLWNLWLIVVWEPRPAVREDPRTGIHRSARLLVRERAR